MQFLLINGGEKLKGSVKISGSKNSTLPLIALSILAKNDFKLSNVPNNEDIKTLCKLLTNLGASTEFKENKLQINTQKLNSSKATYEIVRKMRASILSLAPLLARFRQCEVSLPGGCAIGQRPIDLHLSALEKMGADIQIKEGYVLAKAKNGLKASTIIFDKITVTGSENIIMASAMAKGTSRLINVAKEPEVVQLCEVLNKSGIEIDGIGTNELEIKGNNGELLDLPPVEVIADRIEAGTYLCAGAICNSNIIIKNVITNHLTCVISKLEEMGFGFNIKDNEIEILPAKEILPCEIITTEYPGFPTDMQAQFMALALMANGTSIIDERLFENRFMHVSELARMGADIRLNRSVAQIYGKKELIGADVMATDLRASSALVLAGLVAKGETRVHRIYHLDRGYENLEIKMQELGAKIQRLKE